MSNPLGAALAAVRGVRSRRRKPVCSRGGAAPRRLRGFTLIELLVVLVILGSLLSLAVLSTGNSSATRELRDEAQRLSALIGVLADEAVLDNREYGLLIRPESYRVLAYDERDGRWQPATGQKEHRLPVWARLDLELDGEPLKLAAPVKEEEEDKPGLSNRDEKAEEEKKDKPKKLPEPQLLILSSGELSPFRLLVSERGTQGAAFELVSDGFQLPKAEPAKERR